MFVLTSGCKPGKNCVYGFVMKFENGLNWADWVAAAAAAIHGSIFNCVEVEDADDEDDDDDDMEDADWVLTLFLKHANG